MTRNLTIFLREPTGPGGIVQGEMKDGPFLNVHGETDMQ
jgi:hypothetical protein